MHHFFAVLAGHIAGDGDFFAVGFFTDFFVERLGFLAGEVIGDILAVDGRFHDGFAFVTLMQGAFGAEGRAGDGGFLAVVVSGKGRGGETGDGEAGQQRDGEF